MSSTLAISPLIVEGLYREALALSEDVRAAFSLSGQLEASPRAGSPRTADDKARIAYSRAGLRTTTRMMHAIAWLLNHRAYFMGQISERQLSRHGRLAIDLVRTPECPTALLGKDGLALVQRTERFYERLLRLDACWSFSQDDGTPASAIQRLRERIENRIAS